MGIFEFQLHCIEYNVPRTNSSSEHRGRIPSNRDRLIPLIYCPQIFRIDNLALRLMLPIESARKQGGNVRRDHLYTLKVLRGMPIPTSTTSKA